MIVIIKKISLNSNLNIDIMKIRWCDAYIMLLVRKFEMTYLYIFFSVKQKLFVFFIQLDIALIVFRIPFVVFFGFTLLILTLLARLNALYFKIYSCVKFGSSTVWVTYWNILRAGLEMRVNLYFFKKIFFLYFYMFWIVLICWF